jgi:hypothetical protein
VTLSAILYHQPIGTGSISPATAIDGDNTGHGIAQRTAWPSVTQRNLFLYGEADGMGGHPAHPKLARLQNPDTPLYLEKPVIWPLYQRQYNDVTILCFIVNDNYSQEYMVSWSLSL